MPQGVSGRALAAAIGVSEAAVRKAAKAGRIQQLADGSYDVDRCRQAWGKSTDPARSRVREPANPSARTTIVRTEAEARDAIALIARVLRGEGVSDPGEIDYNAARTADTILKAYQRDLAMQVKRRELVDRGETAKHYARSFTGFRQTVQRMPSRHVPQMAAELGVDPGALERLLDKMIAAELDALSAPLVRA